MFIKLSALLKKSFCKISFLYCKQKKKIFKVSLFVFQKKKQILFKKEREFAFSINQQIELFEFLFLFLQKLCLLNDKNNLELLLYGYLLELFLD